MGLVVATILLGLDLYVGSKNVRTRIEAALQRELKLPIQFGGVHYTLWGGLRATDAVVEMGSASEGANLTLSIPTISAHLAWYPLLTGHVVVQRLLFKSPQLTWVEGSDGKWNLAFPKPAEAKAPKPTAQGPKKKHGNRALEFGIEAIRVENATARFIDRQGRPSVTFEGVNIYLRDPEKPEGTIAIAKTSLREGLCVEDFAAPFAFKKSSIAVAPIDARLAQGNIRGSATLRPTEGLPAFTLDLLFDKINLTGLLTQFGEDQTAQRTGGTLEGNLDLYGTAGQKKTIDGVGQLRLRDGRMEQISLLQAIGKVLQIEELNDVELRNAQLDLRAAEGKVFIDSLVMESINMALTANGTSEWDGKLNLAAHLAVDAKISHQLPGWIETGFQPVPGGNFREIAFNINGSVSHPSTDLLGVLMGQKYGTQFLNLWQSLTGKGKKKGGEKKKPETPALEEEDDVSPAH